MPPREQPLSPHIDVISHKEYPPSPPPPLALCFGQLPHVPKSDEVETSRSRSSRGRSRRRLRVVSFAPKACELSYIHHSQYTEEERKQTWYTPMELKRMKNSRQFQLQLLNKKQVKEQIQQAQTIAGNNDDNDTSHRLTNDEYDENEICFRGLEIKTKIGRKKRHLDIDAMITVVLEEQDHQEGRGILEPDAIAHLCQMFTHKNRMLALQRAKQDAIEASMILREEADEC